MGVEASWLVCGSQRTTCRKSSPSLTWVLGFELKSVDLVGSKSLYLWDHLAAINVIFIEWQIAYFMDLGMEHDGIEILQFNEISVQFSVQRLVILIKSSTLTRPATVALTSVLHILWVLVLFFY